MATTDLALPGPEAPSKPSVHLVARNPQEMAAAQSDLKAWLQAKIQSCQTETSELAQAHDIAVERKWGASTLKRHALLARQRTDFYSKVLAAVDAGYTIVPNFPVDLFAVRVNRDDPKFQQSTSTWNTATAIRNASDIKPDSLALGEGKYVSPQPSGSSWQHTAKNDKGTDVTTYYFETENYSAVQFPIEAARPLVMTAVAEAMATKMFDAIGICPPARKGDPLLIGKILGHRSWYQQKEISFLIAWHLDLRTL